MQADLYPSGFRMAEAQYTEKRCGWWHMNHLSVQASEAMCSWADWRKPLVRTKNKAYVPISRSVASQHLNRSAATSPFQRPGRTILPVTTNKVKLSYMDLISCI